MGIEVADHVILADNRYYSFREAGTLGPRAGGEFGGWKPALSASTTWTHQVPTLLYLDCFSGVSGDMLVGALLDAGLPLDALRGALGSLAIDDYRLESRRVLRAGVSATKFVLDESHGPDI